jgi:hypothetical protein
LRWSREQAARRLEAIETGIQRILDEFPDLQRRRPARPRPLGLLLRRSRPKTPANERRGKRVLQ